MRYCPRCSEANDDQAVYCTHCGFVLTAQAPPPAQTPAQPPAAPYSAPYISPVYYPVSAVYTVPTVVQPVNQEALNQLRKLAGSALVLISAFLHTASLLVPFLLAAFNIMSVLASSAVRVDTSFSISLSIDIVGILLCIALWTLYGNAKRGSGPMPSASAGLIKASGIIHVVCISIIAAILLIALQTVGFITIAGELSNFFHGITALYVLVVVGLLAFGLLGGISAIVFAGDLSAGLKTGMAKGRGAIPLAVYLFLSAMATLGSVAFVVAYTTFWPMLLMLITVADNVVTGMVVLKYRSLIRESSAP